MTFEKPSVSFGNGVWLLQQRKVPDTNAVRQTPPTITKRFKYCATFGLVGLLLICSDISGTCRTSKDMHRFVVNVQRSTNEKNSRVHPKPPNGIAGGVHLAPPDTALGSQNRLLSPSQEGLAKHSYDFQLLFLAKSRPHAKWSKKRSSCAQCRSRISVHENFENRRQ